ncbi:MULTISPECIES: GntR family transcriptional regulator [Paenibacillus]|uniref:GntR family transcriptional regulator n=1 Tax=Paenibacillus baimaensis TaxID=2982185 RepID=A0ABT2UMI1_9BACL|nr:MULTISPECIES: GntR family transcriptional regulator [unclassified Paenibacillus]MCU6795057.1 GntR family transcriptional regulator [Paenibacillus sp. WQ 127069]OMF08979.1 GntR family transcriptional regulator [Paenibacillus sp. FSL H7-0331]
MSTQLTTLKDKKGLIRDHVYENLKKNIMELKLEPGRLISEKELVEMLQVSRTPIREALVKLSQDELIETTPQKGSVISLIDMQHAEEARFLRETMESAIVREACVKLSSEQVLHLQNLIALQELCESEENYERLFELDEEFHRSIIVGCGRTRTWGLIQQVTTHYNRIRFLRLATNHDWKIILSQHHGIVRAIKEKNPDAAEQVLRDHLELVVIEKEELKHKYPGYFK